MEDFIIKIKEQYDTVLFDTPPLIAVTDAYVLMKYVNQFVLVIRAGITEKGALDRVLTALDQTNHKLAGIVMNALTKEHSYGTGYYYNYYQYYYSGDDNKN
jgi:Mrp family chromosome partitioning ATPase